MLSREELNLARDFGIIEEDYVRVLVEKMNNEKILSEHPYAIWEGKDGNWWTYLPDERKGRVQKKRKKKEDIEKLVIGYYKQKTENPTVRELFEEWNNEKSGISEATRDRNEDFFKRHFKEFGEKRIKNVSEADWIEFLEAQIVDFNLSYKAFSGLKGVVRGILTRARRNELIEFSVERDVFELLEIGKKVFKKTKKESYEEVFDKEEFSKMATYLLEHLDKHNMAILLLFLTGMRPGEVVALRNVDMKEDCINIRGTETNYKDKATGKTVYEVSPFPKTEASFRSVVLPKGCEWLYERLRNLNPEGEYIFMQDKGCRFTENCISSRMRTLCKNLGIYSKSLNKCRKTYASILCDENLDENLRLTLMGHVDSKVTEEHYHRDRKKLEEKAVRLADIQEFDVFKR